MRANRDMRKASAGFWSALVNRAETAVEENAAIPRTPQDAIRTGLGHGNRVVVSHAFRRRSQILGDAFDLRSADCHLRVPAAICAGSAIDMLLHFTGKNLKRCVGNVVGREVATKRCILFRFRDPEPKKLTQVGDHGLEHTPRTWLNKKAY